jgi:hypothetical protein
MIGQVLAGLAAVGLVAVAVTRKNNRAPVPADIRAQLGAMLASLDANMWDAYMTSVRKSKSQWLPQIELAHSAFLQTVKAPTTIPTDVQALYTATLRSLQMPLMRETAKSLQAKHPTLASALNDVASILGG